MKTLELFAGSRSFSKVAEKFGHETFTTDIEPFEKIDVVCDIFDFDIDKLVLQHSVVVQFVYILIFNLVGIWNFNRKDILTWLNGYSYYFLASP